MAPPRTRALIFVLLTLVLVAEGRRHCWRRGGDGDDLLGPCSTVEEAGYAAPRLVCGSAGPMLPSSSLALGRRLDVRRASAEELELLPGVGPRKAAAIVAYRREGGVLESVEDLVKVPGIGPATVRRLGPYIWCGEGASTSPLPEGTGAHLP